MKDLPRILVIDDVCGRTLEGRRNRDRLSMCGKYKLVDVTDDEDIKTKVTLSEEPVAEAVFIRGQNPSRAKLGDMVENDLEGVMLKIEEGWNVKPGEPFWALVLLDLCFYTGTVTRESEDKKGAGMPEGREGDDNPMSYFGLMLLKEIQNRWPDLPVVILSAQTRETAKEQYSDGALAFIDRNDTPETLNYYLYRHGLITDKTEQIIGRSKSLLFALRKARQIADSRKNILIRGPSGSGKELFAKFIYHQAINDLKEEDKGKIPFVTFDCGAIDPVSNLYLSDLFGQIKDVVVGAQARKGKIKNANGGYLFMDEIGNLPGNAQDSILRITEYGDFFPFGGDKPEKVDICFLSATSKDIEISKDFRKDLLFRLRRGGTLIIPPLSDRKEDIPLLAEYFFREYLKENQNTRCSNIAPETFNKLKSYDWPGNVRELQICLDEAFQKARDVEIIFPRHVDLPEEKDSSPVIPVPEPKPVIKPDLPSHDLDSILNQISSFDFNQVKPEKLKGLLDVIQYHFSECVARYLKTVLEQKSNLDGSPNLQQSMKWAKNSDKMEATEPMREIRRHLKMFEYIDKKGKVLEELYKRFYKK